MPATISTRAALTAPTIAAAAPPAGAAVGPARSSSQRLRVAVPSRLLMGASFGARSPSHHVQQPRLHRRVAGHDAGMLGADVAAGIVGHDSTGFPDQKNARCDVPGGELQLPEGVEPT